MNNGIRYAMKTALNPCPCRTTTFTLSSGFIVPSSSLRTVMTRLSPVEAPQTALAWQAAQAVCVSISTLVWTEVTDSTLPSCFITDVS